MNAITYTALPMSNLLSYGMYVRCSDVRPYFQLPLFMANLADSIWEMILVWIYSWSNFLFAFDAVMFTLWPSLCSVL